MIPENSTVLGPCTHPADGAPGAALVLTNGREVFWDGAMRSLPSNWRDRQPRRPSAVATLIATLAGPPSRPKWRRETA